MRKLYVLLIVLLVGTALEGQGKSYYNSVRNNFGGLYPHPGMRMQGRYKAIEDDRLVDENATLANAMGFDTMKIHSSSYRYQMRLANTNNKQGKTRSIKNPITGEKTNITRTQWGLVFNRDEDGNFCAVVLSCDNSAPYDDITDQRSMQVTLMQRTGREETILAQTSLTKGVSLEDDLNTISVDVDERGVKVSIGKQDLQPVLEADVKRPTGAVQVGYLVGPGASVSIERAVLTIDNERQVANSTLWTVEALDEYFAQSADPAEGYWKYLDRDMQDDWLRLGGRYTLAVIRADDGYDIIYIDGAQVKKTMWQTGMLKGHMTKTIFSGNYDLTWIDATMEPIEKDAQASIENGVILTLSFPVYKSQVRFAKVLDAD
ncbi:MAG: hypothetical protein IKI10_04880 [Muribaculaceae bacterium]|nr:hypothetical protein [Muribaculaceae bacterium]